MRPLISRIIRINAPIIVFAVFGYSTSLILVAEATRPVWVGPASATVVVAYGAMLLIFILIGGFLGLILPTALAVPTALLGSYLIVALPLVNDDLPVIRASFGFGLPIALMSMDQQIQVAAIIGPLVVLVICLALFILAEVRRTLIRIAGQLGAIAAGVLVLTTLAGAIDVPPTEPRAGAEAACEGAHPRVCLWPEFAPLRDQLVQETQLLSTRLAAHDLDVPTLVTTSTMLAKEDGAVLWDILPDDDQNTRTLFFAFGYQLRESCIDTPKTLEQAESGERAAFGLAIALGANPQAIATPGSSPLFDTISIPAKSDEVLAAIGISSAEDGFSVYKRWREDNASICI
ncbi:hypothetical protein [Homoserinibacter sp. GY 40078]|uniref:hypothetical protein n=1 Tax=Homoserinibacter sp. GY 40078 TaxID=2603275 RepID=UPI0011CC18B9|nr:hypothetical protein [Homoserinibacter sp. GY 40078]TXK19313.1 hypothetical protein FVQ89_05205 [Homoserinibacter sp. GY 40078]